MLIMLKKVGELMKNKMFKGKKKDMILKGEEDEEEKIKEEEIFLQPKRKLSLETNKKSDERVRVDYILGAAHRTNINMKNKVMNLERYSLMEPFKVVRREDETKEEAIDRFVQDYLYSLDKLRYYVKC